MATIQLGQRYTTQKSGVEGIIVEMVLNETGSTRLRLLTFDEEGMLVSRWTTYVPPRLGEVGK